MLAFDSHIRCYSCRKNGKGEDPCASGAPVEACAFCASLTEVEWNHLRSIYAERSAKCANKSLTADTPVAVRPAPDSEEKPEAGEIDDSILDLNQDEQPARTGYSTVTGISAPAGLSPLQPNTSTADQTFSLPAISIPRSMAFPAGPTFTSTSTSSAVFSRLRCQLQQQLQFRPLCSRRASQLLCLLRYLHPVLLLAHRCLKLILSSRTWK